MLPDQGPGLSEGDLLEVEARFFIAAGEVMADFLVLCRHPSHGVFGIYRGSSSGWSSGTRFDTELLIELAEASVVGNAEHDLKYDGAWFARDLRVSRVRDTTDPETRAALRAGPPYPRSSGRPIGPPVKHRSDPPCPGWRRVHGLGDGFGEPEVWAEIASPENA